MVYENLHFEIGHGDAEKTARVAISLEKLCELFHYAWRYRRATTSITIYDSCDARVAPSTPPPDYDQYIAHMDLSLRSILHYTTHLTTFVMDASTTGQILHLPNALSILNMVFNLREVALLSVCCGRGQLPHMGGQVQHAIIRNAGPDATWYSSFLDKQRLSRLDISDTTSHDGRWQEAFRAPAASWAGLSCLCISCTDNNLLDYANLIERGLAKSSWPRLTSLSLSVPFTWMPALDILLANVSRAPIRCFRFTVNVDGRYLPGFGPSFVREMGKNLSRLVELILDHSGVSRYAPLPGDLNEWADGLRGLREIRTLVLPTAFVAIPRAPPEHRSQDAVLGMPHQNMSPSLQRIWGGLALYARHFMLNRLPLPSFDKICFLHDDPRLGYREAIAFERKVLSAPIPMHRGDRHHMSNARSNGKSTAKHIVRVSHIPYDMFWEPKWRQRR
ncbi:hypothetical protein SCP_1001860 [Sparassis crispa]|uniref:F-box domain-containing protein n=1 Tax=Sparassis crispa TaxID=139825 RepID=A0A401GXN0_9APHY|nr:hypothetical protein SCP_1001860 [Sparassis crispa]GBE86942.1 hypothetical protein SCP_1001860 [Sparassis crispa]